MKKGSLSQRIRKRLLRMRLQPIRVFCFHQVSDEYEPLYGGIENWTQSERFKQNIAALKKKYSFIPLSEALDHLRQDTFRLKRLAVLTCDDGYQSVMNLLPWLEYQKVPITLFISVKYLDGVSYDPWFDSCWEKQSSEERDELLKKMYFHWSHLKDSVVCSSNVTLALHGNGHDDVSGMEENEFGKYVDDCVPYLDNHPRFIPFYAYTWGRHSAINDRVLRARGIIPVCCDGKDNYVYSGLIHRVWMDGDRFESLI